MPAIRTRTARHAAAAARQWRASIDIRLRLICIPPLWNCGRLVGSDESTLEEVRSALEIETIQLSVAVRQFDAHVVDEVPLDRGRNSPERAPAAIPAVQVDVRIIESSFDGARATVEHTPLDMHAVEVVAHVVVATGLAGNEPHRTDVSAVKQD